MRTTRVGASTDPDRFSSRKRNLIKQKKRQINTECANKYKWRIANFLENMVEEPVLPNDEYMNNLKRAGVNKSFKGAPSMQFGGTKTDDDVLHRMAQEAAMVDTTPCMPERLAWNMRPRDKRKDIGPSFKFGTRIQMQRLNDQIKNRTNNVFSDQEITSQNFDNELKNFLVTGQAKKTNKEF